VSVTAVAAAIKARLEAQLLAIDAPLVRKVYSHRDYAALPDSSLVTPSLAVIYNGYTPGSKVTPDGAIQRVAFNFLVVVNVRNARQVDEGSGVQDDASPIFDAALEALLGWRPIAKFERLQLEPAPGAALNDSGTGFYPLAFSTLATYRGTT